MEKNCLICGKPIENRKSNNVKYCSTACARQAEAKQRMKAISKRANNINAVAHLVYRAYGYKCAICGWRATEDVIEVNGKIQYSYGNEIHHITPAREGGEETDGNLILLCPNHHKQADLGVLTREELRKYTKGFSLSDEEKLSMKAQCAETIASLIF